MTWQTICLYHLGHEHNESITPFFLRRNCLNERKEFSVGQRRNVIALTLFPKGATGDHAEQVGVKFAMFPWMKSRGFFFGKNGCG